MTFYTEQKQKQIFRDEKQSIIDKLVGCFIISKAPFFSGAGLRVRLKAKCSCFFFIAFLV